jgi:hypothetical protein
MTTSTRLFTRLRPGARGPGRAGRRPARLIAGSAAIVTTVLGLILATAGPAAAADFPGRWQSYTTSPITGPSTWKCSYSDPFDTNMLAQFCVVRTQNGSGVQGAMIVRNNRDTLYGAQVAIKLQDNLFIWGQWVCPRSGIAPHTWSVCYGETFPHSSPIYTYLGGVNGQLIGEGAPDVFI